MDLDKTWNRPPKMCLALLVSDWIDKERLTNFVLSYPRDTDTVEINTEAWIRYDHHPTGFEQFGTIEHKGVFVDYEGKLYDANDPNFFTELKEAMNRAMARHRDCVGQPWHLRDFND